MMTNKAAYMSNTARKPAINKRKLIEAMPINKWFKASDLGLDIASVSMRVRIKKIPQIQMKYVLDVPHYKVSGFIKKALLKEISTPKPRAIKKKSTTIHDECFEKFMNT